MLMKHQFIQKSLYIVLYINIYIYCCGNISCENKWIEKKSYVIVLLAVLADGVKLFPYGSLVLLMLKEQLPTPCQKSF